MSTLQEKLDQIRAGFLAKAPEPAKAVMHRATAELRASGIMDRLPGPGRPLPPFELPDVEGRTVRLADQLQRGPLVLTFYRGIW